MGSEISLEAKGSKVKEGGLNEAKLLQSPSANTLIVKQISQDYLLIQ
jgi:hypothetical protein